MYCKESCTGLHVQPGLMQHSALWPLCSQTEPPQSRRGPVSSILDGGLVRTILKQPPFHATSSSVTPHISHLIDTHRNREIASWRAETGRISRSVRYVWAHWPGRRFSWWTERTSWFLWGESVSNVRLPPRLQLTEPVSKPPYEKEGRQPRGQQRAPANRSAVFLFTSWLDQ